jgi:hypothetical protein
MGGRLEDHPHAGAGRSQRDPPGAAGRCRRRPVLRSRRLAGLPWRNRPGVPRRPRRGRRERRRPAQLQAVRRLQRPPGAVVRAEPPAPDRPGALPAGARLVRPGTRVAEHAPRQQPRRLPDQHGFRRHRPQHPPLRRRLPGRCQVQGHRHLRHLLLRQPRPGPLAPGPARRPAGHRLGGGDLLPGDQRHQPDRRGLGDDHRRPGRQRREAPGQPGLRQPGPPGRIQPRRLRQPRVPQHGGARLRHLLQHARQWPPSRLQPDLRRRPA